MSSLPPPPPPPPPNSPNWSWSKSVYSARARTSSPPPPPPPNWSWSRFRGSKASSSKSPSTHRSKDLSPLDTLVEAEAAVHNVFRRKESPYLYPEHLEGKILVPNKLAYYPSGYVEWNKNYVDWSKKMWAVIKRERLLGFIDGSVQAPPKMLITIVNGREKKNEKYVAWKRSDYLVREWIWNSLTEYTKILSRSSKLKTAKEVWEAIARMEQKRRMNHYLPLYKAAIKGRWETADDFLQKEPNAVRARITLDSETALIVAAKMVGTKDFVENLVKQMLPVDLAIPDDSGRTALHRAAGIGNIEVVKLLVGKNPDLPNMETHFKETPLFYAAKRGDKKMVDLLMPLTKSKMLEGEQGFKILYHLTRSQLFDIALTVLLENPKLASFIPIKEEDLKFHALNALAEKTSSFPSGNNFNCLQEFIYSSMGSVGSKNLTCFCHWNGEWRLQTNGTFLYHGGMCRKFLINNSSQLDEFRKKICATLEIAPPNKLFFYNMMRDKTKYVKLDDQNGVTRLFHLNGDNVDVFLEEEGRAADPQHANDISTRGSNVFDNSSSSNQEMRLMSPENASHILTGMESVGSKNLTCFCHWNGKWMLQTNGRFLYHGGRRRPVLLNNSSQFDELCKTICTALEIDSPNKLFFYNTMGAKTAYVKLNDQNGVTRLFHLNGDNADVFVEEEGRATDPPHANAANHISISSSSNQETRLVLQENVNILTGMGSVGSKNLACFCHWGGERRSQHNGTFLYHGGTCRKVRINNSSQLDELCKKICTALKIDPQNKRFFNNTMRDKTKFVKLNDQIGLIRLFHLNEDNVDVLVEQEEHTTDPQHVDVVVEQEEHTTDPQNVDVLVEQEEHTTDRQHVNNISTSSSSNQEMRVVFPDQNANILTDHLLMIKPIREIQEKKLLHVQALDLLRFLCNEVWNEVKTKDFSKADRIFQLPLEQATMLGIHEIVEEILELYPYAVFLENQEKQTIFQQAIVFRREKVFNLIHQLDESTRAIFLSKRDTSNNNALHLAGDMAHPPKLNIRAGAALQMQKELQWFKAVERLAPSTNREEGNQDGKTPAQVFSDTHKELVKEGEMWMKDTAKSCIIVASLIATVVFAAAIQVPGGNNDNGRPNFEQQTAFIMFGISNSFALCLSLFSVIMFLSIITSPYAEEDFLFALFHETIIGLGSLFFSILFTMTAFGCILYLVFGENKRWIFFPVVALGCPPVCLFAAKQLPLLRDMWKSMYGKFSQQSNRVLQ